MSLIPDRRQRSTTPRSRGECVSHRHIVWLAGQLVDQFRVAHHRNKLRLRIPGRQRPVIETRDPGLAAHRGGRPPAPAATPGPPRPGPIPAATAWPARAVPSVRRPDRPVDTRPTAAAGQCRRPAVRATGSSTRSARRSKTSSMSIDPGSDPTGTYAHTVLPGVTACSRCWASILASAARTSSAMRRRAATSRSRNADLPAVAMASTMTDR